MRLIVKAFLSLFVFIGLAVLSFGLWAIFDATTSSGWPVVAGLVVESEFVIEREDADHFQTRPAIQYSYRVGGDALTGDTLAKGIASSFSPGESRRWVNEHPVDATIDVFVNPDDPTDVVLDPTVPTEAWFLVAFGAIFAIVPLAIGLIAMRAIRGVRIDRASIDSDVDIERANGKVSRPAFGYLIAAAFFGVFLIVGLVILSFAISGRQTEAASESWPQTPGEVIYSGVRHETKSGENGTEHSYYPRVVYDYDIEGTTHTAEGVSLSDTGSSRQRDAIDAIKPYPKGTAVDVFYNPTDYYHATLKTGASGGSLILLIVGAVFTLVGGIPLVGITIAKLWKSLSLGTESSRTHGDGAYDPFRKTEVEDPFDAPWDRS